jgi:5-formyltetrahydrofolate cyclo-ligase
MGAVSEHRYTKSGQQDDHSDQSALLFSGVGVTDVTMAKQSLRRRIRAQRRDRGRKEQDRVATALHGVLREMPEVRRAACVALYADVPGEPGTAPIRQALREVGVRVLLPVLGPGMELDWAVDDGITRRNPELSFPEPCGPRLGAAALAEAEVVVIPALAVDTLAHRLGQGGGCYDRALRHAHPAAVVLALVHDDELFDAAVAPLPVAGHDALVGGAVTPTRWMRFGTYPAVLPV